MEDCIDDAGEDNLFTLCPLEIFHAFLSSADFFSKYTFSKNYLSVKQIGSRSGSTFCLNIHYIQFFVEFMNINRTVTQVMCG